MKRSTLSLATLLGTGLLSASAMMLLARCNEPICIGGVGLHGQSDCDAGSDGPPTGSTGNFTVTATPTSIAVGAQSTVQASGGQYAPYTYSIDPNSNPPPSSPLSGSINSSTGVYQAPSSISPSQNEQVTIRATDTTGAYQVTYVTVTSG